MRITIVSNINDLVVVCLQHFHHFGLDSAHFLTERFAHQIEGGDDLIFLKKAKLHGEIVLLGVG